MAVVKPHRHLAIMTPQKAYGAVVNMRVHKRAFVRFVLLQMNGLERKPRQLFAFEAVQDAKAQFATNDVD
jgi:hypothetical protein